LINIATFEEGSERHVPIEVTAFYDDVYRVQIELIDDGGLEIEVIPLLKDILKDETVRFYLKITVPELPEDTSKGITIKLKAVGLEAESNVEHIDILINGGEEAEAVDITSTATTVGTFGGTTILAILMKRRLLPI
jgi:hypothetical protein